MRIAPFSVLLILIIVAFGVPAVIDAMGQGHDHGGMPPASSGQSPTEHSHDGACCAQMGGESGDAVHTAMDMSTMMSHMAQKPEMVRQHLTVMLGNADLRPVLISLLKEDASLRQTLETLLNEARK